MSHPRLLWLALPAVLLACATRPPQPAPETIELIVLSTTDVHGWLRGWNYHSSAPDSSRGLARAATIVDSIRRSAPGRVLLVDAGDLLQGNPLTYVAAQETARRPHPVIAAMNAMQYDAAAIGNHEFDFGLDLLNEAIVDARFAFLAANAYTPAGERAFAPWRIVSRGPVSVGIVGATTPGSMVWNRRHLEGHLVLGNVVEAVRQGAREARDAGADVVVVVLHGGLDGPATYDSVTTALPGENVAARIAAEVPGIALIVYGHSHREMPDTVIGGTRLIQPRFWASSVGVATLSLRRSGRSWRAESSTGVLLPVAGRDEHPAVIAATEHAHRATMAYVATPVGDTPVRWRADSGRVANTALVDFMLEVQRQAGETELASTSAFSLVADLGPGTITLADIARLYPYENTLRTIRITGRQLREYLEFSSRYFGTYGTDEPVLDPSVPGFNFDVVAGADYTLDISRPVGSRVTRLVREGRPVADTDTFTMSLNSYRQGGGGGFAMLAGAPLLRETDLEVRQLLVDEIRRRGTIHPDDYVAPNWRILPREAAERAYREMHATRREGGPADLRALPAPPDTSRAGRRSPAGARR